MMSASAIFSTVSRTSSCLCYELDEKVKRLYGITRGGISILKSRRPDGGCYPRWTVYAHWRENGVFHRKTLGSLKDILAQIGILYDD